MLFCFDNALLSIAKGKENNVHSYFLCNHPPIVQYTHYNKVFTDYLCTKTVGIQRSFFIYFLQLFSSLSLPLPLSLSLPLYFISLSIIEITMAPGHKTTNEDKRWLIVGAYHTGVPEKVVARISGLSTTAVRQIYLNHQLTGTPSLPKQIPRRGWLFNSFKGKGHKDVYYLITHNSHLYL